MVDLAKITEPLSLNRFGPRSHGPLVLELDLTEGVVDESPGDPLSQLMNRRKQQYLEVLEGIRRGARDPGVAALIVRVDARHLGPGKVQELRDTIADFRATGKPAVAWADTFGEVGDGNLSYYLATAFSRIALSPTGLVGLSGLMSRATFYKGALDKLDVRFEGGARHEYKNAINPYTQTAYTDAHREAIGRIIESMNDQVVEAVATTRGLTTERVRELIDTAPILAREALEAGLVDRLAYRDEVYADLFAQVRGEEEKSPEPALQFVVRYHRRHTAPPKPKFVDDGDHIALISASGGITLGRSRRSPLGGAVMGSDTVCAAFRAARQDPRVKAVVFRVDSGGGSAIASDLIRRESQLTREAGKPVITTMGDIAGSGGYYVALGSDAIVAQPATITGSIGVLTGKPVLGALKERFGITSDSVRQGAHAAMFDSEEGFSTSEWERLNTLLDTIYEDFVGKVAAARGRTWDEIHAVAKGRIWTGADAEERGLVDELGGVATAVRLARDRVGAGALPVRSFPRTHPLDRLRQHESSEDLAAEPQTVLSAWGPLEHMAARLGLPAAGPLSMPGTWEIR
ncbi:S49 family peptidase [Nocardiopsis sp. MG754419]|uniref:S49 family peptidase n=1 Tax=Nocardiopsis sp. MG754419 TaxID=2259865 RepID=UPI001BACB115|nr:S49 family peptidase [Nocardiopsis sp. MG754419]MBR8744813.1 signal peptide peptidase SppA [Nocardiopsis sp. MG754419]